MPGALLHSIERNGQALDGGVAKDFVLAEGDILWFAGKPPRRASIRRSCPSGSTCLSGVPSLPPGHAAPGGAAPQGCVGGQLHGSGSREHGMRCPCSNRG